MFTAWVVFHVIISICLVLVVLMQSAKGEGLAGSAFGGGGGVSGAVFGGRGAASFLSKATSVLAIMFMVNCAALAFMSASGRQGPQIPGSSDQVTSPITRQAQSEREQMMQQQQAQEQQRMSDSIANLGGFPTEIPIGTEQPTATQPPADTGGN